VFLENFFASFLLRLPSQNNFAIFPGSKSKEKSTFLKRKKIPVVARLMSPHDPGDETRRGLDR